MTTQPHPDTPDDLSEQPAESLVGNDIAGGASGAVVQAGAVIGDIHQHFPAPGGDTSPHSTGGSGKYTVDARHATGVQVGDGNVQHVDARPRSPHIHDEQG